MKLVLLIGWRLLILWRVSKCYPCSRASKAWQFETGVFFLDSADQELSKSVEKWWIWHRRRKKSFTVWISLKVVHPPFCTALLHVPAHAPFSIFWVTRNNLIIFAKKIKSKTHKLLCKTYWNHAMSKSPKNLTQCINTIIKKNPKELLGLWFTIEDMIYLFRKGGLSCISTEDVSKTFKCNRDSTCIYMNIIISSYYCSFGYQFKENLPVMTHYSW